MVSTTRGNEQSTESKKKLSVHGEFWGRNTQKKLSLFWLSVLYLQEWLKLVLQDSIISFPTVSNNKFIYLSYYEVIVLIPDSL